MQCVDTFTFTDSEYFYNKLKGILEGLEEFFSEVQINSFSQVLENKTFSYTKILWSSNIKENFVIQHGAVEKKEMKIKIHFMKKNLQVQFELLKKL